MNTETFNGIHTVNGTIEELEAYKKGYEFGVHQAHLQIREQVEKENAIMFRFREALKEVLLVLGEK